MNSIDIYDKTKTTPVSAIKEFCRVCNGEKKGGNKYDCMDINCILYPWKEGKGNYESPESVTQSHKDFISSLSVPVRKTRVISEEVRLERSRKMKEMWAKKRAEKI